MTDKPFLYPLQSAVFLCAGGIYSGNAILLAWPSENLMGQTYRATALAMVISIGNLGAIIGTQVYRIPLGGIANKDYHVSFGLTIVWMAIGIASASALWLGLQRANKRRLARLQASDDTDSVQSDVKIITKGQRDGQWRSEFVYQT